MSKMRIRKGDLVRIISGKDKGKEGKVLRRMSSGGMVLVEGINIVDVYKRQQEALSND